MIWILAATRGEERALARALPLSANAPGGAATSAGSCALHRVGMGPALAGAATRALLERARPRAVVIAGLAGGLAPELEVGDVVVASEHAAASDTDLGETLATDRVLTARIAARLEALGIRHAIGTFATSVRVLADPAEKRALSARGWLAVEMEGLAVARECAAHGVPCAALRVVLDPVGHRLPDLSGALDERGDVDAFRLALAVVRHPRLLLDIPPMVRAARLAHRALATAIAGLEPGLRGPDGPEDGASRGPSPL